MPFPPKKREDDEDVGAITALMGAGDPAEPEAENPEEEGPAKDPMALVNELQQKLSELQAALA